jgi:hypothetical protein
MATVVVVPDIVPVVAVVWATGPLWLVRREARMPVARVDTTVVTEAKEGRGEARTGRML